ncbi:MAG: hypothetical protein BGP01_11685 [Paludibacter sp. 47-17]|nr:MAG: hypothetical protein BGP01_11685 [Paludibacter sp. 47-17]
MKIAFVVTSINSKSNGLGGHYHSLLVTAIELSKLHEVFIVNIGNASARTFEETTIKLYTIIDQGPALFNICVKLIDILKDEKPDILHAFDSSAYYWVRIASKILKTPSCLTKCGGNNPIYFPLAKNLVLYSVENFKYFSSLNKFKQSKLSMIPNRISPFPDDSRRICKIISRLGEYAECYKFLRITRIGNYYHNSSLQLINLVNRLTQDGIKCCAIFIGTVEDKIFLDDLIKQGGDNCFFFTESEFTKNAKSLIACSDAVLGTGRSFMEAAAKNKILLCPAKNSTLPAFISLETFNDAFYYNFSERIVFQTFNESISYNNLKNVLLNYLERERYRSFTNLIFQEYFDANQIVGKYEKVYENAKMKIKPAIHVLDFLLHTLFIIRNYYR